MFHLKTFRTQLPKSKGKGMVFKENQSRNSKNYTCTCKCLLGRN